MASSLTSDAASILRVYIDKATSGDPPILPGAILHIVDANNNDVFTHTSSGSKRLTKNTITLVHSLSKIVGSIAFMQLVDHGLIALDDTSIIDMLLPELAAKKVLTGFKNEEANTRTPILVEREREITPRMLMNHTNGTGHTYFNPLLNEFMQEGWEKRNEAADPHQTILDSPLLWQPGTHTNYGQGFDWLAVLIERITKQSLDVYLQENLFAPLGLKDIGFEETYGGDITSRASSESNFWPRSFKQPDGTFVAIDPTVLEKAQRPSSYPKGQYHTYPLGTGLASSAADFARILTILINDGVDPESGTRILSTKSAKEITTAQLPGNIRNDSRNVPAAVPSLIFPANLSSYHLDPNGSFGLGCGVQGADRVLEDGRKGRSKESFYWYSAANMDYWVDPEKKIVVLVSANYFPWNDPAWTKFVAGVEGILYAGLKKRNT